MDSVGSISHRGYIGRAKSTSIW